jgi:predicted lipoprotein with Yx(FWY)xxD motif
MKRLLTLVAAIAATALLAACGSSGDSSSSGSGSSMGDTSTVSVKQVGNSGKVLVNSSGRPLYAADQETGGKVLCTGACNSFWAPLTVSSGTPTGDSVAGKLGVVKRPDGTRQVTYNGKLLYSFSQDQPGEVTGNGFSDAFGGRHFTWHVVSSSGGTTSSSGSGGSSSGGGASGGGSSGGGYGY